MTGLERYRDLGCAALWSAAALMWMAADWPWLALMDYAIALMYGMTFVHLERAARKENRHGTDR